jgi:hypothetical protein
MAKNQEQGGGEKMKTLQISNIPGMSTAEDKQKLADEVYEDLVMIAREKNARLGKYQLINGDTLRLTIAKDDLWPSLKAAVEKAGMRVVEMRASDAFAAKYGAMRSEK